MFIKVCGLETKEQIDKAIEYGYDAIGIVTYVKSKRYCPPQEAIQLAKYAKGKIKTFLVAGGLNKDNVCDVIRNIQPFGIDVSSGVEKDGVKDLTMMKEFIDAAKSCSC